MSLNKLPVESRLDMVKLLNNKQLFAAQQAGRLFFELIGKYKDELALACLSSISIVPDDPRATKGKKQMDLDKDVIIKFGDKLYEYEMSVAKKEKWESAIVEGIPFFLDYSEGGEDDPVFETCIILINSKGCFLELPLRPRSIPDMLRARFWFKQLMDCFIGLADDLGFPFLFNLKMLRLLFDEEKNLPILFRLGGGTLSLNGSHDAEFAREHLLVAGRFDLQLFSSEGVLEFFLNAGQRVSNLRVYYCDSKVGELHNLLLNYAENAQNCKDIVDYMKIMADDCDEWEEGFPVLRTDAKVFARGGQGGGEYDEFVKYKFANKHNPDMHFGVVEWPNEEEGGFWKLEFIRLAPS